MEILVSGTFNYYGIPNPTTFAWLPDIGLVYLTVSEGSDERDRVKIDRR